MEKFSIAIVICCLLSLGNSLPKFSNSEDKKQDPKWQLPSVGYPLKYDLMLRTNAIRDKSTYNGEVNITLTMRKTTNTVWLRSKDLELASMELYESVETDNITYLDILFNLINKPNDIVRLDLYTPQFKDYYLESAKTYIIQIKFNGSLRKDNTGLINIKAKNSEDDLSNVWMFVNAPKSARALFPCIDELRYKAKFQMKVYHDPSFTVLSNMPVEDCHFERNLLARGVTCFGITPFLPPHMLGLILLENYMKKPIPSEEEDTVPQTFYATNSFDIEQMLAINSASRSGIRKLSQYMNIDYEMPKLDHVIVYDLLPAVAETYGLIVHRESVFEGILPATNMERTMLIYYSLTKMWFEAILALPWQERDDLLSGISSIVSTKVLDEIPEINEIRDFTQLQFCKKMSYFYNPNSMTHVSKGSTAFKLFVDNGNCFLSMLEYLLGADIFEESINIYIKRNALSNTSRMTFARAIEEAASKASNAPLYWLEDIDHILSSWTKDVSFPSINLSVDYERSSIYVRQLDGELKPTADWSMPIKLSTIGNVSKEVFVVHPGELVTIWRPIHPNDCFYVDMEDKNMYHVFYDVHTLKCLGNALKSYPDFITPRNRAAILRSFFVLNFENDLDRMEAYLDLIKYLYNEKHFYVWAIVTQAWTMPGTKRGFGNKLVDAGFGHFYHYLLTSMNMDNVDKYGDASTEDTTNGEFYLKKFVEYKSMELRHILSQEKQNSIKALLTKGGPPSTANKINFNAEFLSYFCTELQRATLDELKTMFQIFTNFLDLDKVQMLAECSDNPEIMEDLKQKYGINLNGSCGNETFVAFSGVCPRRSAKFYSKILKFIKPKKADFDI